MNSKVKRKSASRWDATSERALLELWSEKIVELRGCRKNSHIMLEMVAELNQQGFAYSVSELQTKMHNMTARYRREKQMVGVSGGSPSEWELFKQMEMLLAPYKSYNTEGLVVDSINHINSTLISSPPPLPSPPQLLASPLPSSTPSSVQSEDPLSAQTNSPSQPTSNAAIRRREGFEKLIKNIENKVDNMQEHLKQTTERVLKIEEEKKDILKAYVDREAEVQKALIEFLKRP